MKIAFLACGSLIHLPAYLDYFRKAGHDVYLFAYDKPVKDYGVTLFDISFGARATIALSKWKYMLAALYLRRLLRQLKPDILHGHYVTSSGIVGLLSGFRPLVLTAHGSDVLMRESWFARQVLALTLRRAALVNVVSDQLETVVTRLGIPQSIICKSTVGVDMDEFTFKPFSSLSSPPKLLCTRKLDKTYDPITIIDACEILQRQGTDFTLTFAASGSMEPKLRSLVRDRKLEDRIQFAGGFQHNQLVGLLHSHDLYISASRWDGTSISLLEAMACGTFPIVSRVEGNSSWLKEDETALMFEPGNARELSRKIERALSSHDLLYSAVTVNRRLVEQQGDRNTNMGALEQRYYELLR